MLLCVLETELQGGKATYRSNQASQFRPHGHFILLPSHTNSLLVKSVVDSELLLPTDLLIMDEPLEESAAAISDALDQVSYFRVLLSLLKPPLHARPGSRLTFLVWNPVLIGFRLGFSPLGLGS